MSQINDSQRGYLHEIHISNESIDKSIKSITNNTKQVQTGIDKLGIQFSNFHKQLNTSTPETAAIYQKWSTKINREFNSEIEGLKKDQSDVKYIAKRVVKEMESGQEKIGKIQTTVEETSGLFSGIKMWAQTKEAKNIQKHHLDQAKQIKKAQDSIKSRYENTQKKLDTYFKAFQAQIAIAKSIQDVSETSLRDPETIKIKQENQNNPQINRILHRIEKKENALKKLGQEWAGKSLNPQTIGERRASITQRINSSKEELDLLKNQLKSTSQINKAILESKTTYDKLLAQSKEWNKPEYSQVRDALKETLDMMKDRLDSLEKLSNNLSKLDTTGLKSKSLAESKLHQSQKGGYQTTESQVRRLQSEINQLNKDAKNFSEFANLKSQLNFVQESYGSSLEKWVGQTAQTAKTLLEKNKNFETEYNSIIKKKLPASQLKGEISNLNTRIKQNKEELESLLIKNPPKISNFDPLNRDVKSRLFNNKPLEIPKLKNLKAQLSQNPASALKLQGQIQQAIQEEANDVLKYLNKQIGKSYEPGGITARSKIRHILTQLNQPQNKEYSETILPILFKNKEFRNKMIQCLKDHNIPDPNPNSSSPIVLNKEMLLKSDVMKDVKNSVTLNLFAWKNQQGLTEQIKEIVLSETHRLSEIIKKPPQEKIDEAQKNIGSITTEKREKRERTVNKLVEEFSTTEKTFLESLENNKILLSEMEKLGLVTKSQRDLLGFNDLDIFNKGFGRQTYENAEKLAEAFTNPAILSYYEEMGKEVQYQPKKSKLLNSLNKITDSTNVKIEIQGDEKEINVTKQLASDSILPVQRGPRHVLMLREIVDNATDATLKVKAEAALEIVKINAAKINALQE